MKEEIFTGEETAFIIEEVQDINEYNSIRFWYEGKELLHPKDLKIIFYKEESEHEDRHESLRERAHRKMPERGYLESWEYTDIINDIFDKIGECSKCCKYKNGFCYDKIGEDEAASDEEKWENLEEYFQKEPGDYCDNFRMKR